MVILFLLLLFLVWFVYMFIKFRNPYRLILVIGKKGSGKTTLLTKYCIDALKKGKNVYSTVDLPGAYRLSIDDIGVRVFPADSLLLIDEVGMIWDNRNFKYFPSAVRDFFKAQRHNKLTVVMFSQHPDVDLKIRVLVDKMYLLSNPFNFCSLVRTVSRSVTVTDAEKTGESKFVDQLKISGVGGLLTGTTKFLYIPKYIKYFDSFEKIDTTEDYVNDVKWRDVDVPLSFGAKVLNSRNKLFGLKNRFPR